MSRPESRNAAADPASTFAALGDRTRLELLSRLGDGRPRSITQLGGGLGLTRQGVTKHLRVLERAGIVQSARVGRESRYTYVPDRIDGVQTYLQRVSNEWDRALSRLRSRVER